MPSSRALPAESAARALAEQLVTRGAGVVVADVDVKGPRSRRD